MNPPRIRAHKEMIKAWVIHPWATTESDMYINCNMHYNKSLFG
jgi:hypothetical protein